MVELLTVPVGPLQCNCYILWERPEACVVIDPGDEAPKILAALAQRKLRPALILNTHGHFDHTGAVDALRKEFGATYRIHAADQPILKQIPAGTRMWGMTIPPSPVPTEFVDHQQRFEHAGLRVEAIHTPGHTPGSTCYRSDQLRAVFTGDTLFAGSIGRTDFPLGDFDQEITSIRERLLTLPPETKVYPGHGPPSTIGDEADSNPFLS